MTENRVKRKLAEGGTAFGRALILVFNARHYAHLRKQIWPCLHTVSRP